MSASDAGAGMDKSPDAYRTISEVAEDLHLPQHVLRFWETRFAQIKPLKRGGGRRYYRPDDVELLRAIRHLLYDEGYTIKGVQRILKDNGARAVAQMALAPALRDDATRATPEPALTSENAPTSAPIEPAPHPARPDDRAAESSVAAAPADLPLVEPFVRKPPAPAAARARESVAPQLAMDLGSEGRPLAGTAPTGRGWPVASRRRDAAIASHDVERLKAALFELIECERMLEAVGPAGAR